jgi:membrane protein DedA with SNARE-associated domain
VDAILVWLESLPVGALYGSLALIAAVENVFPPVPADTVVAFGSFLAARGHGTAFGAFLSTWAGNVTGAMLMYAAGRRFGADWLHARLARKGKGEQIEARLERMYGKYGLVAIFMSRFLPGVRAIVPPFAGALRVPPVRAGLMIALASAVWYGAVTLVAYRLGENWEQASAVLREGQRSLMSGVAAVAVVALAVWFFRRRRRA